VRGAFTGAVSVSVGRFRAADGGSLFLDEVGNMSPSMQVKMLRVLQEREITPVGSSEPVRVDVRLIAATNRNLEEAVRREEFREDLYYRMNVIEIHIPPLRARREDIIPLAQHFLERLSANAHVDLWKLAPDAQAALLSYDWPGNVRELENVIERATVLSEGSDVTAAELPPRVGGVQENLTLPAGGLDEGFSLPEVIDSVEKFYIQSALRKSGGNRSRAAGMLGMKRTTLLARMKSLGLGEEQQTGEN